MIKHFKQKMIEDDPTMFSEPDDYVGPGILVSLALICFVIAVAGYVFGKVFLS